ncbi:hypothetical protein L3Y34_018942 [Caenorhabditis briggsae]|uniref:Uncharacterized protein n=1 Tax=Caenorhabditis briggsae TaxID=6238 RepID=A0AAE9DME2_CAEBR|nr:hypothetical protein L3Y34_018942 [Caenorhabditis briggsae]
MSERCSSLPIVSPKKPKKVKKAEEVKDDKQPQQPKQPMVTKEKKEPKQRKASKQPKKNSKKDSIEAEERFAYEPKHNVKTIKIKANSVLHPGMVFADRGPLVIHLCYECRLFNALKPAKDVGSGNVQLPLGMCTISRSHMNRQP